MVGVVDQAEKVAIEVGPKTVTTFTNIETASQKAADSMTALKASADAQKKLFEDSEVQRSFGMLARSGDNAARILARIYTLQGHIQTETVPRLDKLLDQSEVLLETATGTLGESKTLISELRSLVNSQEVQEVLVNTSGALIEVQELVAETRITTEEINQELPGLLRALQSAGIGTGKLTEEGAQILNRINRPQTRKEKVWRAIVYTVGLGLPAALR